MIIVGPVMIGRRLRYECHSEGRPHYIWVMSMPGNLWRVWDPKDYTLVRKEIDLIDAFALAQYLLEPTTVVRGDTNECRS